MSNKIKTPQCGNCIYFDRYKNRAEGFCNYDNNDDYTSEHRVCNKLKTDEQRLKARIKKVY